MLTIFLTTVYGRLSQFWIQRNTKMYYSFNWDSVDSFYSIARGFIFLVFRSFSVMLWTAWALSRTVRFVIPVERAPVLGTSEWKTCWLGTSAGATRIRIVPVQGLAVHLDFRMACDDAMARNGMSVKWVVPCVFWLLVYHSWLCTLLLCLWLSYFTLLRNRLRVDFEEARIFGRVFLNIVFLVNVKAILNAYNTRLLTPST